MNGNPIATLLACLVPAATGFAATFQAADPAAFAQAMAVASSNGEDDRILVASGVELGAIRVIREPGHSLTIEAGYDARFERRPAGQTAVQPEEVPAPGDAEVPARQSTTGPIPPPEMVETPREADGVALSSAGGAMRVLGAPGYLWRHGCGPTAVAMAVGYLDLLGYHNLFDGGAATQSTAVDQGIASQRSAGNPGHYEDYSLPIDNYPNLYSDRSGAPAGDEHASDSIADFMQTSWSSRNNRYGWSWSSDIIPAFNGYLAMRNSGYHTATAFYSMPGSLTWAVLTAAIDNNRPMVFLVDTTADGQTDHFVTVVGYNDSPTRQYACLDTWNPADQVRWCDFAAMANGVSWGVWGGWSLDIVEPAPGDVDHSDGIGLADAILCLQVLAGLTPAVGLNSAADVDGDGRIGLGEAVYALQWAAGWR
jgi:hypothetical protein